MRKALSNPTQNAAKGLPDGCGKNAMPHCNAAEELKILQSISPTAQNFVA
jgi:hypothetical protein